jgi:hypothetical protein
MRNLLVLLIFISLNSTAQDSSIDFCKMLKADQSNLGIGLDFNSDSAVAERSKRYHTFETNFSILIQSTRDKGFPNIQNHPDDTCVDDLAIMTLVHIAQSNPRLIFNDTIINLFTNELDKGNLREQLLYAMIIGYTKFGHPLEKDRLIVESAIKSWKLENKIKDSYKIKYYTEP